MAKTLQFRRGTTAELSSVTGAVGELFVDTTKDTVVVMDGSTAGGKPLATESYVGTAISNLVDSAPGALDTLNELAAALGDDASFATTVTNSIATAGGYANSAYSKANTAQIHAEAAFAAANTGGGGGASTGDFTFSANTISLPVNTNAVLNVSSHISTTQTIATSGVYYGNYDYPNTWFFDKNSTTQSVQVGDTLTITYSGGDGTHTETFTVAHISSAISIFFAMTAAPSYSATGGSSLVVKSSTSSSNSSFTFESDGSFDASSAVIGDVLISDDILTPLSYDSYGVLDANTTGTLTINGNLDVLNDVYVDGNKTILSNSKFQPREALFGDTGYYYENIGFGTNALLNAVSPATGNYDVVSYNNIAIGSRVLESVTTGRDNLGIGQNVLRRLTTGAFNTVVGGSSATQLITGSNNTFIGHSVGTDNTGSDNIIIGYGTSSSSPSVSNEITLGSSGITTLRCQVTSITSLSDARDKKDVTELSAGLDFVSKLKPVAFTWNMRDGGKVDVPDTGFIAQDLKQVQEDTGVTIPGLVYESNPDKLEAAYGKLIPVLVKAIQDLQAEVEALKSK